MPFKFDKIIRTGGRKKNRFGISLNDLPPVLQKYLLENNQFRDVTEDRHLEILFKMREREFRKNYKHKVYLCPFTKTPATLKEIEQNAEKVHTNCFHCGTSIFAHYNTFTYQNLTCSKCQEQDLKYDINEFIAHTELFRKKVSAELEVERKSLIKYIKENSKY